MSGNQFSYQITVIKIVLFALELPFPDLAGRKRVRVANSWIIIMKTNVVGPGQYRFKNQKTEANLAGPLEPRSSRGFSLRASSGVNCLS